MRIHNRASWNARQPKYRSAIATPTHELWLHHTAASPSWSIRQAQDFHMDTRGYSDIAYNFLVEQDGKISEGRGAGIAGGHTRGRNTVSQAICALGNFEDIKPTPALLESIAQLVAHGLLAGWWESGITGPHSDAPGARTSCCGGHLRVQIPHINRRAAEIVAELHKAPAMEPAASVEVVAAPPLLISSRYEPPINANIVDALPDPANNGVWLLDKNGGVYAVGGARFLGTPHGQPYWGERRAARFLPNADRYVVQAQTGETYGWDGF